MQTEARDETTLWRQAQGGDSQAFSALVAILLPRVRRFLWRLGAPRFELDDLAQEVFVRVIAGMDAGAGARRPTGWVLGIAANVNREWARRQRAVIASGGDCSSAEGGPAELAAGAEAEERIHAALAALPATQREVLVLAVHEGLAPREIAPLLGIRAEAVRQRLFQARRRLRADLAALLEAMEEVRR